MPRQRAAIVAVGTALLCGWIGTTVSEAPPAGIDVAGRALAGEWPYVALVFTASCWWQSLVSLGVCAIVLAIVVPAWRARVTFSIVTALAGWLASDQLKIVFGRTRPEYWLLHQEPSKSYPSGHATFAVIIYGLWAYYILTSSLPRGPRIALAACTAGWALAVMWSRLALGVHFVTDVIGGALLGVLMLALATAIAGVIPSNVEGQPRS